MTFINPIPQTTAVPLTGSSARSSAENLQNLPVDRQNVPPEPQEKETTAPMTREALEKTVKQLNELSRGQERNLQFSVDEVLDLTVITVVDTETEEVIRQIPSEEVLRLAHHLEREMSAILDVLA